MHALSAKRPFETLEQFVVMGGGWDNIIGSKREGVYHKQSIQRLTLLSFDKVDVKDGYDGS